MFHSSNSTNGSSYSYSKRRVYGSVQCSSAVLLCKHRVHASVFIHGSVVVVVIVVVAIATPSVVFMDQFNAVQLCASIVFMDQFFVMDQ